MPEEEQQEEQDWREFVSEMTFIKLPQGTTVLTVQADEGEVRESQYGKQVVFQTDLGLFGTRNASLLQELSDIRAKSGSVLGTKIEVTRFGEGRQTRYQYKVIKKPAAKK